MSGGLLCRVLRRRCHCGVDHILPFGVDLQLPEDRVLGQLVRHISCCTSGLVLPESLFWSPSAVCARFQSLSYNIL